MVQFTSVIERGREEPPNNAFLERQLSEFYWPLYIRLEKDHSIGRRILDINKENGSLEQRLAVAIEKEVILPNHKAMIQLIETRMHLAQPESELMEELMKYVKRATEYQALRGARDTTQFSTNEIGTQCETHQYPEGT